ncbi:MAG: VTT domain-containing protein [Candidatus Aenigmarchaeota archaeon]|nr:VTT domain-containing protein [Candidatus Aenigmarchaeota archaeon]
MVLGQFDGLAAAILAFIKAHGALAVFIGVLLEEIIIPIPSFAILMSAGFFIVPAGAPLAEALQIILLVIVIPASIGATIGAFFPYAIGYYGGRRIITKIERFVDFSWRDVEKAGDRLEKERNMWIGLVVARAIIIVPMSVVSVAAGTLRLSWRHFAITTFIGSVPRAFLLAFLGWKFGATYTTFLEGFGLVEQLMVLAILSAGGYLMYRHLKRRVVG